MIEIDRAKCTGCGECVRDCDGSLLISEGGIPAFQEGGRCYACGHCIAVCPTGAIRDIVPENMENVVELGAIPHTLDPDALLGFIKARRSIRRFKQQPVEREKLLKLVEAARYTPTGGNLQGNSYIIVTQETEPLRRALIGALAEHARNLPQDADEREKRYAALYLTMQSELEHDVLFFRAPAVIFVISDDLRDGALAAGNMELMTYAQGLGMVYCGFATRAVEYSIDVRCMLGIPEGKAIAACLVIGYPDVEYRRIPPRKKASISWM